MLVGVDYRRDQSAHYRIRLLGLLDPAWSSVFAGMLLAAETCSTAQGITTLAGRVADQAALLGVLNFAYDIGMVLLSVEFDDPVGVKRE